jgi:hypothetical protein
MSSDRSKFIKNVVEIQIKYLKHYNKLMKGKEPVEVITQAYKQLQYFGRFLNYCKTQPPVSIPTTQSRTGRIRVNRQAIKFFIPPALDRKEFLDLTTYLTMVPKTEEIPEYEQIKTDQQFPLYLAKTIDQVKVLKALLVRYNVKLTKQDSKMDPYYKAFYLGDVGTGVDARVEPVVRAIGPGKMLDLTPEIGRGPADHFPLTVAGLRDFLFTGGYEQVLDTAFYTLFTWEVSKKLSEIKPTDRERVFMDPTGKQKFFVLGGKIRGLVDDCLLRMKLATFQDFDENSKFYRHVLSRFHGFTHKAKEEGANPSNKSLGIPSNAHENLKQYIASIFQSIGNKQFVFGADIELLELSDKFEKMYWNGSSYIRVPEGMEPLSGRPWVTICIHVGETSPTITKPDKVTPTLTGLASKSGYDMFDMIDKKYVTVGGKLIDDVKIACVQFSDRDLAPLFASYYLQPDNLMYTTTNGTQILAKNHFKSIISKKIKGKQLVKKNNALVNNRVPVKAEKQVSKALLQVFASGQAE